MSTYSNPIPHFSLLRAYFFLNSCLFRIILCRVRVDVLSPYYLDPYLFIFIISLILFISSSFFPRFIYEFHSFFFVSIKRLHDKWLFLWCCTKWEAIAQKWVFRASVALRWKANKKNNTKTTWHQIAIQQESVRNVREKRDFQIFPTFFSYELFFYFLLSVD